MTTVILIMVMLIERIANRTDTKKVEKKEIVESNGKENSFFKNEEMFKKSQTERSMTVSLKTMKTGDIDM